MKLLAILIAAAALALGTVVWFSTDQDYVAPVNASMPTVVPVNLSREVPAGSVVRRFKVEGMCCEGCAGKLYGSVNNVAGVTEIAIDPVLGSAQVVVAADTDVAALTEALSFDKYDASLAE